MTARRRTQRNRKQRKTRINAKVRALLHHLVLDGWTLEKSAEAVGWTLDWAIRLLKRADVMALRRELLDGVLSASASRAAKKLDDLLEGSKSDAVKFDSATFLLGVEGIAPVQRAEVMHHNSGVTPGLVIIYSSPPLDITPLSPEDERARQSLLRSLPERVPHPSEREFTGAHPHVPHPKLVKREAEQ